MTPINARTAGIRSASRFAVCLPQAAQRAIDLIVDLLTRAVVAFKEDAKRVELPGTSQLGGTDGLFQIKEGQLRLFWTHVPDARVVLLLDVEEKKKGKLHPDVIRRLSRLRTEALTKYRAPSSASRP